MRLRPLLATLALGSLAHAQTLAAPQPTFLAPRADASASPGAEPSRKDHDAHARAPRLLGAPITVVHLHNREALVLPSPEPYALLERLLRDRVTWEQHAIDRRTLDAVLALARAHDARRIEVVSGYRSDKLNEGLREKGRHVASHSQHVLGTAVDFRLVGVPVTEMHRGLVHSHPGGVGLYRDNAFVHLDMGPRRRWTGE